MQRTAPDATHAPETTRREPPLGGLASLGRNRGALRGPCRRPRIKDVASTAARTGASGPAPGSGFRSARGSSRHGLADRSVPPGRRWQALAFKRAVPPPEVPSWLAPGVQPGCLDEPPLGSDASIWGPCRRAVPLLAPSCGPTASFETVSRTRVRQTDTLTPRGSSGVASTTSLPQHQAPRQLMVTGTDAGPGSPGAPQAAGPAVRAREASVGGCAEFGPARPAPSHSRTRVFPSWTGDAGVSEAVTEQTHPEAAGHRRWCWPRPERCAVPGLLSQPRTGAQPFPPASGPQAASCISLAQCTCIDWVCPSSSANIAGGRRDHGRS